MVSQRPCLCFRVEFVGKTCSQVLLESGSLFQQPILQNHTSRFAVSHHQRCAAMGMKYCGAYLMAVLGGNESPSVADLKKILESVGAEFDESIAETLVSELKGKAVHDIIAAGKEKLVGFA